MIDILQTIGICVGSLALVFIAFFLFFITTRIESFFMPFDYDTNEDDEVEDDEEPDSEFVVIPPRRTGRKYGRRKK